jgi:hypothetical protein
VQASAGLKAPKKTKFKEKVYSFLIVLAGVAAVVIIVFALLFYRPAYYKPLHFTGSREISLYLTNELLPELYNGAQLQEPFNLIVPQSGINDIVARFKWPQEFGSIRFSAPMVVFAPGSIVLMGTVSMEGAEFVSTVIAEPALDDEGLLNLQVASVKIGAVDITPLARVLARRICQQQFAAAGIGAEDMRAQLAASLLDGEPFRPVFKIVDKKVRVEKIMIEQKKLTIHFVPVFD